ncbi:hypothetical protein GYMLUDRAFT_77068 [Collybiopsis luxurians FD-317 M1]|uniref:Neuroguidin n=1 Tax=Collybiopsis luxurians FD-317 M1 TaxID=944289 RepID=A0A0D0CI06_9AGAR|nr:hypothetical protein GYMLUDRAFT_77068 [Collybiopsis luxurians FD-317 M1]
MSSIDTQQVCKLLDDMADGMASARETIESLKAKGPSYFENKDGISLLSLKHQVLLSYLQSLLLVSTRRAIGHSLSARDSPAEPFSDTQRGPRGAGPGDLVDQMIEGRIVLEKVKALEGRMRYQIEKLVKAAQQNGKTDASDIINDPLAFRPNPQNLLEANDDEDEDDEADSARLGNGDSNADGIYRPPRVAPMPYVPQTSAKSKRQQRAPIPTSLASVLHTDASMPHIESTSGLGNTPSLNHTSSRAKYLKHLSEFEEEQFGRVMMSKKDARRRARDEEALALGAGLSGLGEEGKGGGRRRSAAAGWEDEFGDVLRDIRRGSGRGLGNDGYDELRQRGKRGGVLERSRQNKKRGADSLAGDTEVPQKRKKSRFETERKGIKAKK